MATQPTNSQFRLNVLANDALMAPRPRAVPPPPRELLTLREPVYPSVPADQRLTDKEYYALNRNRCLQAWASPFFKSRLLYPEKLRPIIAYLFTDYKCNLD